MPVRVLIAPDSFKGTISARRAAAALAAGWRSQRPADEVIELPQADGGEGTLDAMEAAVPGAVRHVLQVTGPDGRPVPAAWLRLPGDRAVAEFAQSSGLPQMAVPDAVGATSTGLGEVLRAVVDSGAVSIAIGLGGSASTDGAAGALTALGLTLRDAAGAPLGRGGAALAGLASVDRSALLAPPAGGVTLLTDVTNPLLGPDGAAAVFAPQKGATPADVALLERALSRWAELLGGDPDAPGAAAAGGAGFGLATLWGAGLVSGSAEIGRLSGLDAAAAGADVLITGEGSFDATSLRGKVAGHALGLGVGRTIVVAGVVAERAAEEAGVPALALTDLAGSPAAAMAEPERWLREAGARAARL